MRFKKITILLLVLFFISSLTIPIFAASSDVILTVEGSQNSDDNQDNNDGNNTGGNENDTGGENGGGNDDSGNNNPGGNNNGGQNTSNNNSPGGSNNNFNKGEPAGGTNPSGQKYYLKPEITVTNYVKLNGYIVGKENYTYDPTGYLTRAEFATIMARVFNFKNTQITKNFEDIENHWAKDAILLLANNGVILGVDDTHFNPNGTLDIDHVLLMLSRVMYIDNFSLKTTVVSANTHYDKNVIIRMINSGLLSNITDDMNLRTPITREQMVHIVNNFIYPRNKTTNGTELYIQQNGIYKDLSSASKVYYNDCLKSLDMKWVKEQVGTLSKIGE